MNRKAMAGFVVLALTSAATAGAQTTARFARTFGRVTNTKYGVIAASCLMTGTICTRTSATYAMTFGAFATADSAVEFSG